MNKSTFIFALALPVLLFSSCGVSVLRGEGDKVTREFTLPAFDEIDADISSNIIVHVGGHEYKTVITGYNNIITHLTRDVSMHTLHLDYDLDNSWEIDDDAITVEIFVPSIKEFSLSGAPNAKIDGNILGREFNLDLSGASSVEIENINTETFSADISGSGSLRVNGGVVHKAEYEISGAGNISAYPLKTEITTASISGAGKSKVYATNKLEVTISGAGAIRYKGEPEVVKHITGIGSVTPAE